MQITKLAGWHEFSQHRTSAYSLLAANLLPLVGVLFWGWSTFAIVLIYWAENVVIGLLNVLKMITCARPTGDTESLPLHHGAKLFFVPFFTVHYGIFCVVHGTFVFVLLGAGEEAVGGPLGNWSAKFDDLLEAGQVWAIAALAISHTISFLKNYISGGEYRRVSLPLLMAQPYGRIVVLHLAILFGAFATIALGSPIWVLVILIVGKTSLDLALHLQEHQAGSDEKGGDGDDRQNRGNDGFHAGT